MLSVDEIHYLIEQELNAGAFRNRAYSGEELDEAINATVFRQINLTLTKIQEADDKTKIVIENNERILIRELTKSVCQLPVNGEVSLPNDYSSTIEANVTIQTGCSQGITTTNEPIIVRAIGNVRSDDKWYRDADVFVLQPRTKDLYGTIEQIVTKERTAVYIEPGIYKSYLVTGLTNAVWTITGNRIQVKSAIRVVQFCLTYVTNATSTFKMDSCTNKTLAFSEPLQRWFIAQTILRLMVRNEESGQKIENLKQL